MLTGEIRNQIDNIWNAFWTGGISNLILDHLTEHGVMDPALLYESPFIDRSPRGPESLFSSDQVEQRWAR